MKLVRAETTTRADDDAELTVFIGRRSSRVGSDRLEEIQTDPVVHA